MLVNIVTFMFFFYHIPLQPHHHQSFQGSFARSAETRQKNTTESAIKLMTLKTRTSACTIILQRANARTFASQISLHWPNYLFNIKPNICYHYFWVYIHTYIHKL